MPPFAHPCLSSAWRTAVVLPLALAAGCGSGEKATDRTPPAAASSPNAPVAADSASHTGGMAGMDKMAGMTGDADHDFLRMMSDHHKGLVVLAHMTKERTDAGTARTDAATLDAEQDKELDMMQTMLEQEFKDPYTPKVAASHQAMADALKGKRGTDYTRTFYQDVIAHHQEALPMIDSYLPRGKNEALKQMAATMKTVQTREIADYQRKVARLK